MGEGLQDYIGAQSEWETACDGVEAGGVRRFAQAVMDDDPAYRPDADTRFGGPVAPPLYPMMMFRRALGAPDPLQVHGNDPGFDGLGQGSSVTRGLPEIAPLAGYSALNGGTEVELFRFARHGETIRMRSRYAAITEKETSKGPIVLVVTEADFATPYGEVVLRARRTLIRRRPTEKLEAKRTPGPETRTAASRPADAAGVPSVHAVETALVLRDRQVVFEDVEPGQEIGPLAKGPLRTMHLMRWSAAMENWHRIHYDRTFAQEHDKLQDLLINGSLKQQFILQLLKDWAGRGGWVWKVGFQFRAMNLVDETLSIWACVRAKRDVGPYGLVELDLGIRNAAGVESTPGTATLALPHRNGPAVPYPFRAPA